MSCIPRRLVFLPLRIEGVCVAKDLLPLTPFRIDGRIKNNSFLGKYSHCLEFTVSRLARINSNLCFTYKIGVSTIFYRVENFWHIQELNN